MDPYDNPIRSPIVVPKTHSLPRTWGDDVAESGRGGGAFSGLGFGLGFRA